MFLSEELTDLLLKILAEKYGTNSGFTVLDSVSGGDINKAYSIRIENTIYFLKTNLASRFPDMFLKEAESLKYLQRARSVNVPVVIAHGKTSGEQFLLLSWIEPGSKSEAGQEQLGRELAELHRNTAENFGFEFHNYMGSLVQENNRKDDWSEFFMSQRIEPQIRLAFETGLLSRSDLNTFNLLFNKLGTLFPEEQPALVHGDLWGGNYLVDKTGKPYLVDPAISFSHREVDLAMTTLFGGFSRPFYDGYHEVYPLEQNWQSRCDLWNLYPLLVHLNLFGKGYLAQIKNCLRKFTD